MPSQELPRHESAPDQARRWLRGFAREHLAADQRAIAYLLVTELVSNAVRHGTGRIDLRADCRDGRVRVEVADEGAAGGARVNGPDLEGGRGFGLYLVDELSAAWGIAEDGARVWFELPQRAAAARVPDGSPK